MSYFLKDGEFLWPTQKGVYDIRDRLPVGTYNVGCHPAKGFYLKPIDDFKVIGKIYGNTEKQADRILNTFGSRPHCTGVLLNGEKGSGKTMLAKLISERGAESGIPTLVINTPFVGDGFNTFIQEIDEPCIIVFDEFEKVFDNEQQEAILTLLDGVYPTKKLFILTVNDKYRVNQHMRNRPGRIFYMIDYKGLDAAFIEEYCNDNLINKVYIPQVCRLTLLFDSFNFDMLKALVEEMNRYNESPNQALEMLNAKPFDAGSVRHNVEVFIGQEKIDNDKVWPSFIRGNPIAHENLSFNITLPNKEGSSEDDYNDDDSMEIEITPQNLKKIEPETGTFTYVINENTPKQAVFVITREVTGRASSYSWIDAV